jgi:hypothetical protein
VLKHLIHKRKNMTGIVVASILMWGAACSPRSEDQQLRNVTQLVASLGPDTRPDDLRRLRASGRVAVRQLIATLQPIPDQ